METKIYKLRHKPTGLFYQPGERNLSEKGKVYTKKPNKRWPGGFIFLPKDSRVYKKYAEMLEPLNEITGPSRDWKWRMFASTDDWEIVIYDMEYKVSPIIE
jgi:hypothetical protein